MVVSDYTIDDMGKEINLKGHLVYNKGIFSGPKYHVMRVEYDGFIALDTDPKMVQIDPFKLNKSLASAYRRSKFGGRINFWIKVPLDELRAEYKKYVAHFVEYLARRY